MPPTLPWFLPLGHDLWQFVLGYGHDSPRQIGESGQPCAPVYGRFFALTRFRFRPLFSFGQLLSSRRGGSHVCADEFSVSQASPKDVLQDIHETAKIVFGVRSLNLKACSSKYRNRWNGSTLT